MRTSVVSRSVAERADHDVAISETVRRVRHARIDDAVHHFRFDYRQMSRRARVGGDV